MDCSFSNRFDILQIYRQFSDIASHKALACGLPSRDDESNKFSSREALTQFLKSVESMAPSRISIFDELYRLMAQLDLTADYSEFSRFYVFVFFMCRENSQKNITVERAVTAWRLVLAGRFRLLNQWCDFVEKNQRHNISEDTWRQVLAFSRCVHENLEGYDPEGAWPVLIDDFVDHMYRVSGSNDKSYFYSCAQSEHLLGSSLRIFPGLKRKFLKELQQDGMESSNVLGGKCANSNPFICYKRSRHCICESLCLNQPSASLEDCMEIVKPSSPLCSSKTPCAVDCCLLKEFEGLFSSSSYLQLDQERRVSFT